MQKFLRSFITTKLLFLCMALSISASAQVIVNVSVLPPASSIAKNYIEQGNNVKITLINNSSLTQQVKIIPSLTGISNGVKIVVNENFTPAIPLTLAGGQTKTLTLNQLKVNNGNLTPNDLQLQGYDLNSYLSGTILPEGLYTFCVKVITANNPAGGGGQTFQGCATVNITAYLPPIITNPINNASVKPLQPQFMTFSWTPSGVVGKTRYRFRLVDLTASQLFDPNDAFINENILPFYQQQNIVTTSLQLDNSKPKLTVGSRYALQVTAYDPLNQLNFKNGGRSKVIVFTYKNELPLAVPPAPKKDVPDANEPPGNNEDDAPTGDCSASSKYAGPLKQSNKNGIANGTDILVGKFVMKNTVFTQSNGSYTGTGEILVNFTGAKMKVKFSGIQIGDDNRMFKGAITGLYDANSGITDAMAASKTEVIKALPNASALMKKLEEAARKINTNDVPLPTDLPLSFDKNGFDIGIVGMIFESTEAYLNAVLNTQIPQVFGNEFLLLSAKAVPIHPNGFGTGATLKLALAETLSLAISKNKMYLELIGGADKTFATFDCTGFKNLTLNGAMVLDRQVAMPVDANFNVIADANVKVKAAFSISGLKNFEDFVLNSLSMSHAFALPVASDFVFKADSVALDLSSLKKITGIGNSIANDWTGLFIKSMKLSLPAVFKKDDNAKMSLGVTNMFIGKQGISGNFAVSGNPLVTGSVINWKVIIKEFGLAINNNALTGGSLKGVLTLPLGENANVGFTGNIAKGTDGADMSFTVITNDEIDANLFLAKMKFFPNSSITFAKKSGKYAIAALLNGELGIDFSSNPGGGNVSKFQLPKIAFQELTLKGKEGSIIPEFDLKFAGLQNEKGLQAKIANFELNLNKIEFKNDDKSHPGLSLSLGLSLFGGEGVTSNGAGANTTFTIWAKHSGKTFSYEKATLDAIAIKADLGVAKLAGSINIYSEDLIYGNGFRGAVSATLNGLGVKVDVTLQFGKTLQNKGDYKYWYFDAMADFGKVGINIPGTAASIYGFGGGAYCNMNPTGGSAVIIPGNFKVSNKGGAAPTTSGVTMTPQKGTAGFRAAVLFGITGSREAFNGDVTFSMKLNYENLSVNNVVLDGNAYLMQDPTNLDNRSVDKAFLYCHAHIMYDNEANTLSGIFAAKLNIADIVEGGGNISFKFATPKKDKYGDVIAGQKGLKWYIKVGEWTPNTDPFADMARLHAKIGFDATALKVQVQLQGYFMVGNDLLSGLPPLPDAIYAVTKDLGAPIQQSLPASVSSTQGLAFAFGAGIKLSASVGGKLFGISVEAAAGFDVLLSDLNATCNGKPMGIGGWYAQGQAYAYVSGNIIAFGGEMASFMAGAVLQVKLPNPTWVKGDVYLHLNVLGIKGDHTKTIERGKLCGTMQTDLNPFEGMKLIKSTTPGNNSVKVNPMGTEMQVKFAYEDLGPLKVMNPYTNEYEYYYATNQVKLLDKNKKEITDVKITDYYTTTHRIKTTKTLEANSVYYVWAKSELHGEKTEEIYAKFTTGDRPATFGMNDLYESYPLPNQRYFMKHKPDGTEARGNLKFKQDMTYLFEKGGVYVLILDNNGFLISAEQVKGTTNQHNGIATSNITFKIPEKLKNNAIYQIKVLAPSKTDGAFGDVIFEGFHFKTSKYNNFTEKFNSLKVAKVGYIPETSHMEFNAGYGTLKKDNTYYSPIIMITSGEAFDKYEMFGYYKEVGNETELFGDVMDVFGATKISAAYRKFREFKTEENAVIPEFTQQQFTYMKNINKGFPKWNRPKGYPYYASDVTVGGVRSVFDFNPGISWLTNIKNNEAVLLQKGYLKNNEMLAGPDGPLTADEINGGSGGGGGMMGGMGLGSNTPAKTKYYALKDYTPALVAYDYTYLTWNWLKAAKTISGGDITSTYALINKMGFPKIPSGNQTITFTANDPTQGGKRAKLELQYMYKPPGN